MAGVCAGDHVALLLPNRLPYVALIHALARVGAVLVPLNTRLTAAELGWQITQSDARWLIYDAMFAETVAQLGQVEGCRLLDVAALVPASCSARRCNQ